MSPTSTDLAVLVDVGVDYASDLGRVERVVAEVGKDVMLTVPGGVADKPAPASTRRDRDSFSDPHVGEALLMAALRYRRLCGG